MLLSVRHLLTLATVALGLCTGAAPLQAQQASGRPAVLIAAGVGGQIDDGRDLGSPGLHGALGLAWGGERRLAWRVEAQAIGYGEQSLPAVVGARGSAEQVVALSTALQGAPFQRVPIYGLAGVAILNARVTGEGSRRTAAGGVLGVGMPIAGRLAAETQYVQAVQALGRTRAVLAARLVLRF